MSKEESEKAGGGQPGLWEKGSAEETVRRGRRKMVKAAPQDLPSISQGRETPDPPGDFKA
jgi:hypothetical protein